MLEVKDLHVSYGGIRALRGVNLEVPDGKIVTLIGANGAGKSTMLRTISGLVKAESGSILYNGKEILGMPINKILEQGIAMVPEGRRVFTNLSVLENLKIGAYLRKDKAGIQKDISVIVTDAQNRCTTVRGKQNKKILICESIKIIAQGASRIYVSTDNCRSCTGREGY